MEEITPFVIFASILFFIIIQFFRLVIFKNYLLKKNKYFFLIDILYIRFVSIHSLYRISGLKILVLYFKGILNNYGNNLEFITAYFKKYLKIHEYWIFIKKSYIITNCFFTQSFLIIKYINSFKAIILFFLLFQIKYSIIYE